MAMLCARENDVRIWARDPEVAQSINSERRNPRYLSDLAMPEGVTATSDLEEALSGRELVICAVPATGSGM